MPSATQIDRNTKRPPPRQQELYRVLSQSAHLHHDQNRTLHEHIDDQRQHIDDLRVRLHELARERERSRTGRAVPVWVVASLDGRLNSTEAQKEQLAAQVAEMGAELHTLRSRRDDQQHERAQLGQEVEALQAANEELRVRDEVSAAHREALERQATQERLQLQATVDQQTAQVAALSDQLANAQQAAKAAHDAMSEAIDRADTIEGQLRRASADGAEALSDEQHAVMAAVMAELSPTIEETLASRQSERQGSEPAYVAPTLSLEWNLEWNLDGWVESLQPVKMVSNAIVLRLRQAVRDRLLEQRRVAFAALTPFERATQDSPRDEDLADVDTQPFERSYLRSIAKLGSVETVLALLKERPVLWELAELLFAQAKRLQLDLQPSQDLPSRAERGSSSGRR